ncbi:MAG: hypothetical protein IJN92_01570 [Lachnospiraceae bacterium]|nr:hypothetical protein [Lachnospiraceae bacterium]
MVIKENMTDEEMDAFLLYIEENEMITAPKNLKDKILNEFKAEEMQMESARKRKNMSAKVQFWLYSLKISAAVAAAIFLLAFVDTNFISAPSVSKKDTDRKTMVTFLNEKSNQWSSKLSSFSDMFY